MTDVELGNYKTDKYDISVRHAFLRKVFCIVLAQLLCTAGVSTVFQVFPPVTLFIAENAWIMFVNFIFVLVIIFPLQWKSREVPLNYLLLTVFTISLSIFTGISLLFYNLQSVIQIVIMTIVIVISLITFTLQTKYDFQVLHGMAISGMSIITTSMFLSIFYKPTPALELCMDILGVFVFSVYLMVDVDYTYNKCDPEDYILAATNIYLDIMNLFARLLSLFGEESN
ncbi:hypothetical protein QR680_013922 [Steinernema hermaphroditum]|uniref:Uncharacterized protein n=1 Tax=Steinernema hermaphroditum TaxID=289476 RepID=A0AA39I9W3_9BILA|nr:hypothetical protein QR680_013922 [Steinernema hermaphroditum]